VLACVKRALEEMISEVRRRGLELTMVARLLWLLVAAILGAWLVLLLLGATTT
jgi:hypothetical protein